MLFTAAERSIVFDRILQIARIDKRVTGGAIIGSGATDTLDQWSDIDITFGIKSGISPALILNEWTSELENEFGMIHYFDLRSGSAIYRVILFPNCLELDLSVVPEKDFGPRSKNFRLLFGKAEEPSYFPQPSIQDLIGFGWHHIVHANSAIARGRYWQAEYWISGARDNILALICIRLGEDPAHEKGVNRLPETEIAGLENTLVRSLDVRELRRALREVSSALTEEIRLHDFTNLAEHLKVLLEKGLEQ